MRVGAHTIYSKRLAHFSTTIALQIRCKSKNFTFLYTKTVQHVFEIGKEGQQHD